MKLCHIVPSLEERYGGPSKSVHALCAALARTEHEVVLLTTDPAAPAAGETRREGALRIGVFRREWPQRICVSHGLRGELRASEADVVHHHSLWLRTLHYAQQRARRGAKLVVSPRGMMGAWAWRHRRWRKQLARLFIHPGALGAVDGWHATSREEENEIRALGFAQPVCVAPNGVEAPNAAESAASREHWLAACPEAARRPVALFFSRFHQKKRVVELIDLWAELAPRDWLLLLVGIPQDYTPEELEAYAARVSAAGAVRAFSGMNRPQPYAVASLFLLPSHNENFGLVIAEAMAHGVPALVTDSTPWSGVNREQLGWCVPWEKFSASLDAAVAEGPERLRERGARAQAWVLREFSWGKSAGTLAAFYASLKGAAE